MTPRSFAQPRWTGREDLTGKTILAYAEQGLGDTIQFARYARLLKQRGATVVLEAQAPLKNLLARCEGMDQVVVAGEPLPHFDFHCPLASLPFAFGTRVETIPADLAYLEPDETAIERWSAKLGDPAGLRVGLAWSGSTALRNDRHRSMSLAMLAEAVAGPGRTLVSIQKDIRDTDRAALDEFSVLHFEQELNDFDETAALVDLMDVVISVDTSVAHLAGALGQPLCLLLPFSPDWRWMLGREDTPWYPTARLCRQPALGDWPAVVERVKRELERR
jgi:hypothetical protein